MGRGTLILVAGPSGAGKDTLLTAARTALAGDASLVFARRAITRPAAAGGETHEELSVDAFTAEKAAGAFMLDWEAHGMCYGLRIGLADELAAGRHVVANVSRGVIGMAAERFPPVHALLVEAPAEALATRLAARGRETGADLAGRLNRRVAPLAGGVPATTIVNDGALNDAMTRFLAALRAIAGA